MTTTAISADALTATGYNLTDSSDFTTMVAGTGNGVEFSYNATDLIVLKNTTGSTAVYTFKVPSPSNFSAKGVTVPDATVSVANGKTWLYKLSAIFRQSDGDVIVECDQTADILILSS